MSPITAIVILVSGIYLFASLVRIYQYVSEAGLFSNPVTTRLCLIGFSTGFTYLVGNYEIQRILHSYIESLPIPIVPLLWLLSGIIGATYLYIDTVRRYTVFHIPHWISRLLIMGVGCTILANMIWYRNIPFFQLQVLNSLIGSILGIVAAVSVAPMMRTVLSSKQNALHGFQFTLTVIQLSAVFIATLLLAVDSVYKLWFNIDLVYTPTYVATVFFLSIQIIATHMMNEGLLIYWVNYPSKVHYYFRLKRLYRIIQEMIQFPDIYNIPLPTIPLPHNIDTMTHRVFIMIADRYWRIKAGDPLRQTIEHILSLDIPADVMLKRLAHINLGEEKFA
jgi:hypothetical protein